MKSKDAIAEDLAEEIKETTELCPTLTEATLASISHILVPLLFTLVDIRDILADMKGETRCLEEKE